jgi:hypothetical protein
MYSQLRASFKVKWPTSDPRTGPLLKFAPSHFPVHSNPSIVNNHYWVKVLFVNILHSIDTKGSNPISKIWEILRDLDLNIFVEPIRCV